ncbi:MAG: hypothetical protein V5A23_01200 [Halobacteriales archaeon]
MVEVTYYCPHCGALTSLARDAYLADKSVTAEPLSGWEYVSASGDYEAADGVELVCLGDAEPPDGGGDETAGHEGCGRTFYLNFVKFDDGEPVETGNGWLDYEPDFDFLRH